MHQLALVSVTVFLHSNSPNYLCQPVNRGLKSISCTIYSKKKNLTRPLWWRCQICWLSAYLSFVTKPGPISSVISGKKGLLNNQFAGVYISPLPPKKKYSFDLCKWDCHPLKKCKWSLLLCCVVSIWQQVTFLSWQWKMQVRIRAANRNKVILQSGPSLGCTYTLDLQLSS